MKVELIDTMGSDLTVVNAARVSYAKHHDTFDDSDARLLRYLARNGHWSPFSHPQAASFRISASIAVANQLNRHQVGSDALNEVSAAATLPTCRRSTCQTCGGRHRARGNPSRAAGNR